MTFDPALPRPKVLASGLGPQPPPPWEPSEGSATFQPPLGAQKRLASGLMPRAPAAFRPSSDIDLEPG